MQTRYPGPIGVDLCMIKPVINTSMLFEGIEPSRGTNRQNQDGFAPVQWNPPQAIMLGALVRRDRIDSTFVPIAGADICETREVEAYRVSPSRIDRIHRPREITRLTGPSVENTSGETLAFSAIENDMAVV